MAGTPRWDRPPATKDVRWFLRVVGKVLICTGTLMFGFVAYQLWGTGIETARAQNRLENEFEQMLERTSTTTQPTTSTTVVPTSSSPLPVTSIAALTAVVVGAYQLAKCLKNSWIGLAVGVLPFIVGLYFVYQNVNRLLPATL